MNLTRRSSRPTLYERAQAAELHKQALEADAAIFDYDGHFDGFQDSRKQKLRAADDERVERKSRYIESLIAKQKEREREQDIIYERRLLKEREKEDHLYGDKEKFVTAAYRKKLEEDRKWLEEEKIADAREAADDVTKKGDPSGEFIFIFRCMGNQTDVVFFVCRFLPQPHVEERGGGRGGGHVARRAGAERQRGGAGEVEGEGGEGTGGGGGREAPRRVRAAARAGREGGGGGAPAGGSGGTGEAPEAFWTFWRGTGSSQAPGGGGGGGEGGERTGEGGGGGGEGARGAHARGATKGQGGRRQGEVLGSESREGGFNRGRVLMSIVRNRWFLREETFVRETKKPCTKS